MSSLAFNPPFPLVDNYFKYHDKDIETAENINSKREEIIKELSKPLKYTIIVKTKVNEKILRTIKPISLTIYSDTDHYYVENEYLSLYGVGKNTTEAVKDFITHLLYFYQYYMNIDKKKLIGEGIRLKEIYENLFREITDADW